MNDLDKVIKIGLTSLLLVCLFDMPYGYYQFVRFIGMVGFTILAISANKRSDNFYLVVWAASAVLINPVLKISLGRTLWNVVDVIWAIALLSTLLTEKSNNK